MTTNRRFASLGIYSYGKQLSMWPDGKHDVAVQKSRSRKSDAIARYRCSDLLEPRLQPTSVLAILGELTALVDATTLLRSDRCIRMRYWAANRVKLFDHLPLQC